MELKKLIFLLISLLLTFSFALGLITLSPKPNHSSNEFKFSDIFNESFHKVPTSLISYSDSENYINSVLSSSGIKVDSADIIGLIMHENKNIVLIKSNASIVEIIASDNASIQEINTLELKHVSSKQFFNNGNLMERTVIDLSEFKIPSTNSGDPLVVSVLEISHESWENKFICTNDKSNYVRIKGTYFIDDFNNVIAIGTSSEVLSNCIFLSVRESNDCLQRNGVVTEFSNSAKWESRGLLITSKASRQSQILVDSYLNIDTWVTEDSWFGIG